TRSLGPLGAHRRTAQKVRAPPTLHRCPEPIPSPDRRARRLCGPLATALSPLTHSGASTRSPHGGGPLRDPLATVLVVCRPQSRACPLCGRMATVLVAHAP